MPVTGISRLTWPETSMDMISTGALQSPANVIVTVFAEPVINEEKLLRWGRNSRYFCFQRGQKGDLNTLKMRPYQISFEGGYVEKDYEESVLPYDAQLPRIWQGRKTYPE